MPSPSAPETMPEPALEVQDGAAASALVATRLSQLVDEVLGAVRETLARARFPSATYRVQFNRQFTFREATKLVPYWQALGISDVYASPYLKPVSGSSHGYDVVDHRALNPDLGSRADFDKFTATLQAHGMGHILDFVPNHMGVGTDENVWWQDVLENGPGSRFAPCFDINWSPIKSDLEQKVLLPVLGEQFGQVLEGGQLQLDFQEGAFLLRYGQRRFPIAPKTFRLILEHRLDELAATLGDDSPSLLEYRSILTALGHLPERTETDSTRREERNREKEIIKRRLQRLCGECAEVESWIRSLVAEINGTPGNPASFDRLDALLAEQAYRLSSWRVAADEINYRRFFDVNELAALCMEKPDVFEAAHAFVFELLERGQVEGLRIDHADGLYDPTQYLWDLQQRRFLQLARREHERPSQSGDRAIDWDSLEPALLERFAQLRETEPAAPAVRPLYVVVEKILESGERMPENWPVCGSTGYDFLCDASDLFVARGNSRAFDAIYSRFIGEKSSFSELVYDAKRLILRSSMSSELHGLGHVLDRISERNRWTRDFTRHGLVQALRDVVASFPVYRTYLVGERILDRDRRYIDQAVARARRRNPETNGSVFDFIRDLLLMKGFDSLSELERTERLTFVGRFQQFTGPVMAKAVEDTVYYRFNRLVSLNEVGGNPERFGLELEEFHRRNIDRQQRAPFSMLAGSTHDNKRSEDVRARINVLSELPDEWKQHLSRWSRWNKRKKTKLDGELAPARNDEYLLYQTLAGTWPFDPPHGAQREQYVARIQQYMTKAVREAKVHSSWIAPNEPYEAALSSFVESILCDEPMSAFRSDFEPFAARLARAGLWNSLGQTLLRLTCPGVPDLYQGNELWDFSLVEPDNRRQVDFNSRQSALAGLSERLASTVDAATFADELLENACDGRIKLLVHLVALALRRRSPGLLTTGEYLPVLAVGPNSESVCAYIRRNESRAALVVVPRLVARLGATVGDPPLGATFWGATALQLPPEFAGTQWTDLFTRASLCANGDAKIGAGDLLARFPLGLLEASRDAMDNDSREPNGKP